MLNIIFEPNILIGFILSFSMLVLYFLKIIKPEISKDEDLFFATLGFIYSSIIIIHGWRLDPILLFSQVLIISILLPLWWENIRLRGFFFIYKNKKIDK